MMDDTATETKDCQVVISSEENALCKRAEGVRLKDYKKESTEPASKKKSKASTSSASEVDFADLVKSEHDEATVDPLFSASPRQQQPDGPINAKVEQEVASSISRKGRTLKQTTLFSYGSGDEEMEKQKKSQQKKPLKVESNTEQGQMTRTRTVKKLLARPTVTVAPDCEEGYDEATELPFRLSGDFLMKEDGKMIKTNGFGQLPRNVYWICERYLYEYAFNADNSPCLYLPTDAKKATIALSSLLEGKTGFVQVQSKRYKLEKIGDYIVPTSKCE